MYQRCESERCDQRCARLGRLSTRRGPAEQRRLLIGPAVGAAVSQFAAAPQLVPVTESIANDVRIAIDPRLLPALRTCLDCVTLPLPYAWLQARVYETSKASLPESTKWPRQCELLGTKVE